MSDDGEERGLRRLDSATSTERHHSAHSFRTRTMRFEGSVLVMIGETHCAENRCVEGILRLRGDWEDAKGKLENFGRSALCPYETALSDSTYSSKILGSVRAQLSP